MSLSEGLSSVGAGRYKLVRAVGRGGMATVYQATDTALGRKVAVKVMLRTAADEDFSARLQLEARAVAALSHRNVIAIHDIGDEPVPGGEPTPYLVMEFVDGRTLSDLITDGPMPVHEALRITADVLDGLAAIHDAGLIHRDIKPTNIMVTKVGVVKVLDFGIVKAVATGTSPVTRTGTVIGTAQYMSPEQAQGKKLDHRSDLYSTGILLFELLCGRRPFNADSAAALLYHHVHTEPPLLCDLGIRVPEAVQKLLSSALGKDPEERPATAQQMRALVLAAVEETSPVQPPLARPLRVPDRPTYAPLQSVPQPPATTKPRALRVGLVAAAVGFIASLIILSTIFRSYPSLWSNRIAVYTTTYGLMYAPVLFGLLVGVRQVRAAARHTPRRSLAAACIAVNGLWAFYHLGTWLFGFSWPSF
ncbi:protein kinase [Streptomyces sp. NPDC018338]|uniref:protein kinase domain-containing protein n=1 Tax=Streptomyces sp. NPDC018338 TaxID=3157192 RepID=UPI0033F0FCE7